jgi:scyllo-inositol 2-dehydrogenase (NADP+)
MVAMTDQPLRVAVLGYGLAGAVFHAPLIAATAGLAVSVVVTGNPDRAAQARREHDGVTVVETADDVWKRADDIDLVVVAAPNRVHASLAHAAIDRGLPVVVDKPFAVTVEEAQSVIDAAAKADVALTVFQNRRWDGDFLTLRRLLAEGALGSVHRFESRFERWRPVPKGGWRESGTPADAGGLLFDLGAHLIDQALVLFGPATHVYAEVDRRRPTVETDDDVFVALTHASGVRSHLWASAIASDLGPRLRVLGDRAAYVKYGLDPQEDALRAGRRPDLEADWGTEDPAQSGTLGVVGDNGPVATEPGAYQRFYAAVEAAVRSGATMPVDPGDSVETLRIIQAARRSSVEATVISL